MKEMENIKEGYLRQVPEKFRTPYHVVRGNLIFKKKDNGNLELVGQLEEVPGKAKEHLAKLCGGDKRLAFLNAAGSVASILNLGVTVIGFMHVSKLLRRIEDRIEGVERKLDELGELVGVIDQKVDQLIELNEVQVAALAEIHNLIVSFETAKVHAALETLDILSAEKKTPERDKRLIDAAETLQVFRKWLADKRDDTAESMMAVRTELLRAEVAVVLAECRARCLADDVSFAGRMLEGVMHGARAEIERMYEFVMDRDGVRHLAVAYHENTESGTAPFDTNDAVEAVAWIMGVSMTEAAVDMVSKLQDSYDRRRTRNSYDSPGNIVNIVNILWYRLVISIMTLKAKEGIDGPEEERWSHLMELNELGQGAREALREIFDLRPDSLDELDDNAQLYRRHLLQMTLKAEEGTDIRLEAEEGIDRLRDVFELGKDAPQEDDDGPSAQPCDAAAFVASYHLVRDLEAARAMCAAMELFGEPVRELLFEAAPPGSPALAIEWRR